MQVYFPNIFLVIEKHSINKRSVYIIRFSVQLDNTHIEQVLLLLLLLLGEKSTNLLEKNM